MFNKKPEPHPAPDHKQKISQQGDNNQAVNVSGHHNTVTVHGPDLAPSVLSSVLVPDAPEVLMAYGDYLPRLHAKLSDAGRVLLHGMGGIGKSTLARCYAAKYRGNYKQVFFIEYDGNSLQSTLESGIRGWQKQGKPADELNALPHASECLLIIDGFEAAAEGAALRALLEQLRLKMLVCSRTALVLPRVRLARMQLEPPELASARQIFLQHRYKTKDSMSAKKHWQSLPLQEQKDLDTILAAVGRHPLAIEVIAKTLRVSGDLLSMQELLLFARDILVATNNHRAEETSLARFLGQVFSLIDMPAYATWVLRNIAVLPATTILQRDIHTLLQTSQEQTDTLINALQQLDAQGWLSTAHTNDGPGYSCHEIIREFIHKEHRPSYDTCEKAIQTLSAKIPTSNLDLFANTPSSTTSDPIPAVRWVNYAVSATALLAPHNSLEVAVLRSKCAVCLTYLGVYGIAIELAIKANSVGVATIKHSDQTTLQQLANPLNQIYRNIDRQWSTLWGLCQTENQSEYAFYRTLLKIQHENCSGEAYEGDKFKQFLTPADLKWHVGLTVRHFPNNYFANANDSLYVRWGMGFHDQALKEMRAQSYGNAQEFAVAAVSLLTAALGPDSPFLSPYLRTLAMTQVDNAEAALSHAQQSVELFMKALSEQKTHLAGHLCLAAHICLDLSGCTTKREVNKLYTARTKTQAPYAAMAKFYITQAEQALRQSPGSALLEAMVSALARDIGRSLGASLSA